MREIKFRAWDEKYRIMIYPENLDKILKRFEGTDAFFEDPLYAPDELYPFSEIKFLRGISILQEEYKDRLKIMQYTGLRDKNGREVYEGDIVRFKDWWDEEMVGEVRYSEKDMAFTIVNDFWDGFPIMYADDLEVIGNIYENPELLKEAEE